MEAKLSRDPIGDRQKDVERKEAARAAEHHMPVMARIDGRAFTSFTRGMERPYDPTLMQLMQDTTVHLVKEFGALIGYTQSDEITLSWMPKKGKDYLFGAKYQKLTSILASSTTSYFVSELVKRMPSKTDALPTFDCRLWQPSSDSIVVENFQWRQDDAVKNSVNMAISQFRSHKELLGIGHIKRLELLREHGIDWDLYPASFKYGTFVKARTVIAELTPEELATLPEQARPYATGVFERRVTQAIPGIHLRSLPPHEVQRFLLTEKAPTVNTTMRQLADHNV